MGWPETSRDPYNSNYSFILATVLALSSIEAFIANSTSIFLDDGKDRVKEHQGKKYQGAFWAILSTTSPQVVEQVRTCLLNFCQAKPEPSFISLIGSSLEPPEPAWDATVRVFILFEQQIMVAVSYEWFIWYTTA